MSYEINRAFPRRPFCGNACTIIHCGLEGNPFACEKCVQRISAWDEPGCFPRAAERGAHDGVS